MSERRGGAGRPWRPWRILVVLGLPLLAAPQLLGSARPRPRPDTGWRSALGMAVEERGSRDERYRIGPGGRVVIDTIAGSIHARAVAGDTVRLAVSELRRGADRAALERARGEMPLRVRHEGSTLRALVDAPFRHPDGSLRGPWEELPYRAVYDFTLEVPRDAKVVLRTVLDGVIELAGGDGGFEVRNVNGPVSLREVGGAGSARTVNGDLLVVFRRNPDGPCELQTVNGNVTVELQPDLAAEVRYTTLNGEAWSDFPFTLVAPPPPPTGERQGERFVLRRRWQEGIRIGGGGPRLSLETVNGDILLRRR